MNAVQCLGSTLMSKSYLAIDVIRPLLIKTFLIPFIKSEIEQEARDQ